MMPERSSPGMHSVTASAAGLGAGAGLEPGGGNDRGGPLMQLSSGGGMRA